MSQPETKHEEALVNTRPVTASVKTEVKEESEVPDISMSSTPVVGPQPASGITRESSAAIDRETSPKKELHIDHDRVDNVAMIGGSATRKYLNEHVTKHLLEGMKLIAREKPQDPLRVLGEYLINASNTNNQN